MSYAGTSSAFPAKGRDRRLRILSISFRDNNLVHPRERAAGSRSLDSRRSRFDNSFPLFLAPSLLPRSRRTRSIG
ncbi:MAG: hypothetical protein C3F11_06645 [Methylocystaceae bacterium]|nr:MAG: hypothetical protein C3F11_06645 [Methylocystaceae bacterium]